MVRNVAVVGHLHHGKTALMDMLVFETHKLIWDADKPVCPEQSCLKCVCSDYLTDSIYRHTYTVPRARNFNQIITNVTDSVDHCWKIPFGPFD